MLEPESIQSDQLSQFHRLLPEGGVTIRIYDNIVFVDVNDLDRNERLRSKVYLREDKFYSVMLNEMKGIKRGSIIDRRYCVYVRKGSQYIGRGILTEFLDNPNGYGKNDFNYTKLVYPEFVGGIYSRYLTSTILYMMLRSNAAKTIYAYLRANPNADCHNTFFLNRIDRTQPCVPLIHPGDSQDVQKFAIIRAEIGRLRFAVLYLLVEYNGDIYRAMDQYDYISGATGSTNREKIMELISELDILVELVKGK